MDLSSYAINRRKFLASTSALSVAACLGLPGSAGAGPPPETTALRIFEGPVTCLTPQIVAHELLLAKALPTYGTSGTRSRPITGLLRELRLGSSTSVSHL